MSAGDYSIGSRNWPGLAKLTEEAGEVIQVAGKIIAANGETEHWDMTGTDVSMLAERLEDELADVTAAIVFLTEHNPLLDTGRINTRANEKLALFRQWHADNLKQAS